MSQFFPWSLTLQCSEPSSWIPVESGAESRKRRFLAWKCLKPFKGGRMGILAAVVSGLPYFTRGDLAG